MKQPAGSKTKGTTHCPVNGSEKKKKTGSRRTHANGARKEDVGPLDTQRRNKEAWKNKMAEEETVDPEKLDRSTWN